MCITEFNEKAFVDGIHQEGVEEGREIGKEIGKEIQEKMKLNKNK